LPEGDDFAHGGLALDRSGVHVPSLLSRAAVGKHVRRRTFALWAVVALGAALEITVFAATGGLLPWVLLVPVLLAVAVVACWRWLIAHSARLLAAGPCTEVAAAVVEEDVWLGRPVPGWALFPSGVRARFTLLDCPPDVAAELLSRRRLWIAGEPREGEVAVGLPDGDTFAIGVFSVKSREYRRARRSPVIPPRV
jgi:hypothetical protein